MTSFTCFGEILIRLAAPGRELLLQTPRLEAHYGGAEANVAVSLARFGHEARMVSVLPENALGRAARDSLRAQGVDASAIGFALGRMGLYFLTPGAGQRASEVLYDRAGSAFAAHADALDWRAVLGGAEWFHVSGVTPAVSAAAANATLSAMRAARAAGVKVSYDGNFRAKLWEARGEDPRPVLDALFAEADLAFADARDIGLITGRSFAGAAEAAQAAFERFPKLQGLAHTTRKTLGADHYELAAALYTRDSQVHTPARVITGVVDRIGGGDAFAAGVLHGLASGWAPENIVEFALAAACLKHFIPGDASLASEEDVRFFMANPNADVRR